MQNINSLNLLSQFLLEEMVPCRGKSKLLQRPNRKRSENEEYKVMPGRK